MQVLATLHTRHVDGLPPKHNIRDLIVSMSIEDATRDFKPAAQVPLCPAADTRRWLGYSRAPERGAGTRNYIALIGATSLTAGYVRALEAFVRDSGASKDVPNLDGIVAVAHTEGGGARDAPEKPHNYELLRATLTGFMLNPNVGAAIVFDYGSPNETLWTEDLADYVKGAAMRRTVYLALLLLPSMHSLAARRTTIVARTCHAPLRRT